MAEYILSNLIYIQGIDAISGNLWKSATASPPELKRDRDIADHGF